MTKQSATGRFRAVPGDSSGAGAPVVKSGIPAVGDAVEVRSWIYPDGPKILAVVAVSPLRPKSCPAHRRQAQSSKRSGLRNVSRAP